MSIGGSRNHQSPDLSDRIILNVWHGNQGDLEAAVVILEVRDPKLQNISSTIRNWLPFGVFGPWVFVPD